MESNTPSSKEINKTKYYKDYQIVYLPSEKVKSSKNNPCNQINKHVNKYNKKNEKYFKPDTVYLKGYKYITNSDVYFED